VGNIRTALYNSLFAKKQGGVNILRLEDTDRQRLVPGCEAEIVESLAYVGVDWHVGPGKDDGGGPYRQSERAAAGVYAPIVGRLLDEGAAYWAFDTPEELAAMREGQLAAGAASGYFGGEWRDAGPAKAEEARAQGRPGVVRLRIPRGETISFEDAVRGRIEVPSDFVDDPVLIKADGMPTYHFAAIVDDQLMGVTHVFRGEEWISSAPKHVVLIRALGASPPVWVHLPVIKGKDGAKLSKRHGDTACLDYRRAGIMGDALANFIALIGWSPGGDREVMSMDEMAEAFEIERIQPASGVFDPEKLAWMSGQHVRSRPPGPLAQEVRQYAAREETGTYWRDRGEPATADALEALATADEGALAGAVALLHQRCETLAAFGPACQFLFVDVPNIEPSAQKWLSEPHVPELFRRLAEALDAEPGAVDADWCGETLRSIQAAMGLAKLGPVVHPIRVALTGSTVGPGLFELMAELGRERMLRRLRAVA
jgi:glutamyl-tRNA synthetase